MSDYEDAIRQMDADSGAAPAASGTPGGDNPYLGVVQQMAADTQRSATDTLLNAQASKPDSAARAMQIAPQVGVPAPAVEADLPNFEQQAQLQANRRVMQQNPVLARWVASNPMAARVAQDDFDKLDVVSKFATALKTGAGAALAQNEVGRLYSDKALAESIGTPAPDQGAIQSAEGNLAQASQLQLHGIYGGAQQLGGFAAGMLDNFLHARQFAESGAEAGAVIGGGLGAAAGGVGALPGAGAGAITGAVTGFGVGWKADMARVQYGMTYRTLDQAHDAQGNALSEPAKQIGAALAGALTYGIASAGGGSASGVTRDAIQPFVADVVTQAMTRPTVQGAVRNFALAAVKGGVTGAALNAGMEAASIAGENLAKQISPGQFNTIFNDEGTRQEALTRLADAAESGALLFGGIHLAGASVGLSGDLLRVRQAQADMQAFQNLQDGAAASATRDRNLAAFQSFMQSQVDGTPVENLYVPADRIAQLYQEHGAQPGTQDPLFSWVPDMRKQLDQALPLGGDVVLPTADYVTHMAGTDVSRALLPDIRVRQDGMSLNDAQRFYQSSDFNLRRDAQALAGLEDPAKEIFDDVHRQALEAGYSQGSAQQYATLFAARYAARAQRLGLDPLDLYRQSGVEIRRADENGEEPAALEQSPPPVATLHGEEIAPKDADVGTLRSATSDYYTEHLAGTTVHNDELGDIQFTKRGMKKMLATSANPDKLKLVAALPDILANGKLLRSQENRLADAHQNIVGYHWVRGSVTLDGKPVTVDVNVEEHRDGKLYYNHTLPGKEYFQREGGQTQSPSRPGVAPLADRESTNGEHPSEVIGSGPSDSSVAGAGDRLNLELNQEGDGARGSIKFANGRSVINLFRNSDMSTLLHEAGHLWLEEMRADAARPDAPEQLRADMENVLKWMGVEHDSKIGVDQHEQFARAAEAYFMEGKAPSGVLASAFRSFKAWLTTIYQNVRALNTPMDDEIRGVFDRMLATDDELENAKRVQGLRANFVDAASAGMTDREFSEYQRTLSRANGEADGELLNKVMEHVRRRRTSDYDAYRNRVKAEVTKEVDARPDVHALESLRNGSIDDGNGGTIRVGKLNAAAIDEAYGVGTAERMPKGTTVKRGGIRPDDMADVLGFSSGHDLVRQLTALEQQERDIRQTPGERRTARQYIIDRRTDFRMSEEQPDALSDGSIRDAALEAIHNQEMQKALQIELRALGRRIHQEAFSAADARDWVKQEIEGKTVRDVQATGKYSRAEAKAARMVEQSLLDGDHAAAFVYKRQQVLNHHLFIAAREAAEEIQSASKELNRYANKRTIPGLAQEYLDQIHSILDRFDFGDASQREVARRASLRQWAQRQIDNGAELDIAPELLSDAFSKHFSELTVSEFRGKATHHQVAALTVSTTSNTAICQGNGIATSFNFPFVVPNALWLQVTYVTAAGVSTLVPPSQYSVSGVGNTSGGSVTYPLSGSPVPTGDSIIIQRVAPYKQLADIVNQSGFYPDVLEAALDNLEYQIQQLAPLLDLSLQVPLAASAANLILPGAAARADKLVGFDVNGNAVTYPITASVGAGNLTVELGSNGRPGFKNGSDFTAGTTTSLTLSQAYGSVANVMVAWDMGYVEKDAYIIQGNQIIFGSWSGGTFTPGPIPVGVNNVDVVGGTTLSLYVPPNGTVGPAQMQPNSVGDGQLAWGLVLNRVVDSVTALAALNPVIYQRAFSTGHYQAADGGGGAFVYSAATSQALANGGTIIASTVGTGCWLLQYSGSVAAEQFGAYNNATNVSTNNTVFANIVAWLNTLAIKPEIRFAGTYAYSVSPNWGIQNATFRGYGDCHFQYSGVGNAVVMDGTGLPNDGAYDVTWEGITVDAPSTALDGYFIKLCHHSKIIRPKVRGAGASSSGIEINGCVCTLIVNPEVSPNADGSWYQGAMPQYGITFSGGVGAQASYNTIINPVMEGLAKATSGIGINLLGSLGNSFIGGTAEGCTTGIGTNTLANGCERNKFYNIDLEANTTVDIYEQGGYNEYHGCDSTVLIEVISGAIGALFVGGSAFNITVAAGALRSGFSNVGYNRADISGTGTFSIGDASTRVRDCFDAKAGTPGPFPQTNIVVGASPFTYTNATGRDQDVALSSVSGISQLEIIRGGTGTLIPVSTPIVPLSPGDQLQITWATSTPSAWVFTR